MRGIGRNVLNISGSKTVNSVFNMCLSRARHADAKLNAMMIVKRGDGVMVELFDLPDFNSLVQRKVTDLEMRW